MKFYGIKDKLNVSHVDIESSLPTEAMDGQMVFNASDKCLAVFNNGSWHNCIPADTDNQPSADSFTLFGHEWSLDVSAVQRVLLAHAYVAGLRGANPPPPGIKLSASNKTAYLTSAEVTQLTLKYHEILNSQKF
jgi:hypothetical protein